MTNIIFAVCLVVLGVVTRCVPHASQFTAMLAVAMLGGMYLDRRIALALPLTIMIVTDLFLGFHNTMFFTWGSMLIISAIGLFVRDRKSLANVFAGSLVSSIIFFIITNFGAWFTLYPQTWDGLKQCYFMAIPFFRTTLLSTVAYSVIVFLAFEWILKRTTEASLARVKK